MLDNACHCALAVRFKSALRAILVHFDVQNPLAGRPADKYLGGYSSGSAVVSNRALFEDVVHHKQIFFNASYANCEGCLANRLCLVSGAALLVELRKDYQKMLSAGML